MLSESILWLFAFGLGFLLYRTQKRWSMFWDSRPLPPGPRGFPVIGNLLDIPSSNQTAAFCRLNAKYGDIVYLNVLGRPTVILGTHAAAIEFLEKRSSIYSDRNVSVMAKLTGWDWVFVLFRYGPWWRRHRKLFHLHFGAAAVSQYQPTQEHAARHFAHCIMQDPKSLHEHIKFVFAATIMRVTYGIEVCDNNDKYVDIVEAGVSIISAVSVPGKYLVEAIPALRFLPSWFPGAKFKRDSIAWAPVVRRMRDAPWEHTMAQIFSGSAAPSVVSSLVRGISTLEGDKAQNEEVARNVAAAAYSAGADTTISVVQTFFLAMASYPEVQRKAQDELDTVVGAHRLPSFADRASLPYTTALAKECLRWRVVAPFGFPHRSAEDDEYCGYRIPEGTTVLTNIWAYSRDPEHYSDPERFMPERFLKDGQLDPDVLDPAVFAFGYGRRICPGRQFAEASLFILTTTVLHTLSITAPPDASGKPTKLEGNMTAGLIAHPEPFDVDIKPRAPWAEALIRKSGGAAQA